MLIDPNLLNLLHLDLMQWPVSWDLQLDLQLMIVHRICSRHLIQAQCHLDLEVLVDQLRCAFHALCVC